MLKKINAEHNLLLKYVFVNLNYFRNHSTTSNTSLSFNQNVEMKEEHDSNTF